MRAEALELAMVLVPAVVVVIAVAVGSWARSAAEQGAASRRLAAARFIRGHSIAGGLLLTTLVMLRLFATDVPVQPAFWETSGLVLFGGSVAAVGLNLAQLLQALLARPRRMHAARLSIECGIASLAQGVLLYVYVVEPRPYRPGSFAIPFLGTVCVYIVVAVVGRRVVPHLWGRWGLRHQERGRGA